MTGSSRPSIAPRRALAARNAAWARTLASGLAARGVRPNAVSVAGVGFALAAAGAFGLSSGAAREGRAALLLAAAACIQLRLLCNLLDGMLALEEGLKSPTGEIFNDLPDRVADVLIFVGAGYGARSFAYGPTLGWAAAVAALLTAYVRVLGGSLGLAQPFIGPMAKQHRMFALTMITLAAAGEVQAGAPARATPAGLAVITAGSLLTATRRTRRILREATER
jgi:phosphatidylglycerophosphate synthase